METVTTCEQTVTTCEQTVTTCEQTGLQNIQREFSGQTNNAGGGDKKFLPTVR
jgi:hypothetical protein